MSKDKPCVENPFAKKTDMSDLVLIVEENKLHVNKTLLMLSSPVFYKMFTSDFAEKNSTEIPLPGKKFNDFVSFLKCLYPDSPDDISKLTVDNILALCEEYQCLKVKARCEEFLMHNLKGGGQNLNIGIERLAVAEKYGLKKLLEKSAEVLSNKRSNMVIKQMNPEWVEGSSIIFRKRVEKLERFIDGVYDQIPCGGCRKSFREYMDVANANLFKSS